MTAFTNDRKVTSLLKDAQNSFMTSSSFKPSHKASLQKRAGIRSRSPHRKHFTSDKRKYFHLCDSAVKQNVRDLHTARPRKKTTQTILIVKDTDMFYTAYTKSQVKINKQAGLPITKSQIKVKSLY